MAETFLCALESRAREEAIYGTVARIRSWFLLEYPSVWRRDAIADSRLLTPAFKRHLRDVPAERTLLIRQEHHRTGPLRSFRIHSDEQNSTIECRTADDYDQLATGHCEVTKVEGPLLGVCTHGRHDRCCAKFGIPVWCALRDQAGPAAWQCSHVGGDRFAGNVVVFPYGIYYGRIEPEHVADLLRRTRAGEIWLPFFRGRSCYGRAAQVGEYFVRRESGRLRIDDFRLEGAERLREGITQVRFVATSDGSLHTAEFRTTASPFRGHLSCSADEESSVPQHHLLRYSVT